MKTSVKTPTKDMSERELIAEVQVLTAKLDVENISRREEYRRQECANELIERNRGFIRKYIKKYMGSTYYCASQDVSDLEQEAEAGFYRAILKFDLERQPQPPLYAVAHYQMVEFLSNSINANAAIPTPFLGQKTKSIRSSLLDMKRDGHTEQEALDYLLSRDLDIPLDVLKSCCNFIYNPNGGVLLNHASFGGDEDSAKANEELLPEGAGYVSEPHRDPLEQALEGDMCENFTKIFKSALSKVKPAIRVAYLAKRGLDTNFKPLTEKVSGHTITEWLFNEGFTGDQKTKTMSQETLRVMFVKIDGLVKDEFKRQMNVRGLGDML